MASPEGFQELDSRYRCISGRIMREFSGCICRQMGMKRVEKGVSLSDQHPVRNAGRLRQATAGERSRRLVLGGMRRRR
jgi:hypothetical protein